MADETPLREAPHRRGIALDNRQIRSLYRNKEFRSFYQEKRHRHPPGSQSE